MYRLFQKKGGEFMFLNKLIKWNKKIKASFSIKTGLAYKKPNTNQNI